MPNQPYRDVSISRGCVHLNSSDPALAFWSVWLSIDEVRVLTDKRLAKLIAQTHITTSHRRNPGDQKQVALTEMIRQHLQPLLSAACQHIQRSREVQSVDIFYSKGAICIQPLAF